MPARFRNELGGEAYISVGIDRNLVIYSTEHFNAMANEIGISRVHLIALENGRAPFNRPVLLAWSKVTGFEVDDFILPEVSTQRRIEEVE